MLPFERILCPTDFSEASQAALRVGGELGSQFSSEIYLVHIVSPRPGLATRPGRITAHDLPPDRQELWRSVTEQLEEIRAKVMPDDVILQEIVAYGNPEEEIIRIADEEDIDLIVIGTHGQTGWREFVFGSVAEKVVRLAHCAVLCIRPTNRKG